MNKEILSVTPQDVFECLEDNEGQSYNIWVDGSYLDKDRNKAGIGVIVSDKEDNTPLFALAYNISGLKIRHSKYTELWAASFAMTDLKDLDIHQLTCDSPITKHRIKNIRHGIANDISQDRIEAELEEVPELYEHLIRALSYHDDIKINHVNRKTDNMPHSDRFSRVSAKRRLARIFSSAQSLDIPCLYKIVNSDGEQRQALFFDRMENYDINDFDNSYEPE